VIKRALPVACLLSLVFSASARAQELVPPPPPAFVPCVAGPSTAQIDALAAAGRRKKRVGAILMGVGGSLALAGTGLMIAGVWHADEHCLDRNHYHHGYYYDEYYGDCGDSALTIAGATTAALGIGALAPGIFIYVSGGSDVGEARRLRQRAFWCCRPNWGRK
jgi:hypothetical protein